MPTANTTSTSYTIPDLTPGSTYDVRVRAVNGAGEGPWSSLVRGTVSTGYTGTSQPALGIAASWEDFSPLTQAQTDTYMAELVATGVTWLRVDLPLLNIETSGPTRDWSRADRIVNSANAAGLKICACLSTIPAYARSETLAAGSEWRHGVLTATQRDIFRDFAVAAISRYQQVDAWEVWNEPNFTNFWQPTPTDGALYYALIAHCYTAMRNVAPAGVPVITGGTAGVNDSTLGMEARQWYIDLYGRGLGSVCDGVTVHPYPDIGWTNQGRPFSGRHLGTVGSSAYNATGGTSAPLVASVRATMDANGDTAKPIWCTETGWPTWADADLNGSTELTEETQARFLPELVIGWINGTARDGWNGGETGPLCWYELRDRATTDQASAENHFGITHTDGTPKPALGALRSISGYKQGTNASSTALTSVTITPTLATGATAGRTLLTFLATDKGPGTITVPTGFSGLGSAHTASASVGGQLAVKAAAGGETAAAWSYTGTGAGTGGRALLAEIDLGSVDLAAAVATLVSDDTTTTGSISADLGSTAPSAGWLIAASGLDLAPSSRTNPWPAGWAEVDTRFGSSPNVAASFAVRRVAAGDARSVTAAWAVSDQKFLVLAYVPSL